jgi:predicted aspartyl protease
MRLACGLVICVMAAAAAENLPPMHGVDVKASRVGDSLALDQVYLNGKGPFRMLIDTGNASSIVRPEVARRLGLEAAYAVEQASAAKTTRTAVAVLDEVRVSGVTDRAVEMMIGEVALPGVDGVLGQSWLARHDYLLDYRARTVGIDGTPMGGSRLALRWADQRPVVSAIVEGKERDLVLDSGANVVVLYETPLPGRSMTEVTTNGGTAAAQRCSVDVVIAGGHGRKLSAVRIDAQGLGPGLLPTSAFDAVFVSNRRGFVEFRK